MTFPLSTVVNCLAGILPVRPNSYSSHKSYKFWDLGYNSAPDLLSTSPEPELLLLMSPHSLVALLDA